MRGQIAQDTDHREQTQSRSMDPVHGSCKGVIEEHIKEMNFQQDLPSLNELHDYLSYLYDARKWVILY